MDFDLRVKGLTKRWFINFFLIIACIAISVAMLFCVFFSSYYTQTARNLASEYASEFLTLSSVSADRFEDAARQYTENFEHKDKLEVQIIGASGAYLGPNTAGSCS